MDNDMKEKFAMCLLEEVALSGTYEPISLVEIVRFIDWMGYSSLAESIRNEFSSVFYPDTKEKSDETN